MTTIRRFLALSLLLLLPIGLRAANTVTTEPATGITHNSATLHQTTHLSISGGNANFFFSTDNPPLPNSATPLNFVDNLGDTSFSYTVSGLAPNTVYYFRGVHDGPFYGVTLGAVLSFTTLPTPVTIPPDVLAPVSGATVGTPITVTYNLPEEGLAGSIILEFLAPGVDVQVVPGAGAETLGQHSYAIDAYHPDLSPSIASSTGGHIPEGVYTIVVSYQDATGAPRASTSSTNVTIEVPVIDVVSSLYYTKGDPVPGAGVDPQIPAGSTWYSFGIPAIDEDGTVAVVGRWKNPPGSTATYGTGIFVGDQLKLALGAPVAGVAGATYKKFSDPVVANGAVATIATLAGVAATEDKAVVAIDGTTVTLLAREGGEAIGAGGATFRTFKSVSVASGGEVVSTIQSSNGASVAAAPVETAHAGFLYTAVLNSGTGSPTVNSANDYGAWLSFGGTTALGVREGDPAPGLDVGETVKGFNLLANASGSPAQGRGHTGEQSGSVSVKTSTGRQRLLSFNLSGGGVLASSGDPLGGATLPLAQWKSFGPLSESTQALALRGALQNKVGGVTGAAATGIFLGDLSGAAWEPIVQVGNATGISNVAFKALKDPVLAADCESLAFPATLSGQDVTSDNDGSLWWKPDGGPLTLLAREGDPALGGGTWKSFASLAIPGGLTGPMFLAALNGVDSTHDLGVWGTDSIGALRILFREGDTVAGLTIKTLAVLKAVSGTPGTTHAFNGSGQLVWRASFTNGTSAIVLTTVP